MKTIGERKCGKRPGRAEGGEISKRSELGEGGRSGLENHGRHLEPALVFVSMGLHEEWSVDLWSPFRLDQ